LSEPGPSFGFEKLEVWQRATEFAGLTYKITQSFPRCELFGLTMQLRRASVSVAANIAEGASRSSGKDQARFFEIAYGSLNEIVTMFYIAERQGFITPAQLVETRQEIGRMCRMLSGLRRKAIAPGWSNPQPSTLNPKPGSS
jgi:four helix bundle protein